MCPPRGTGGFPRLITPGTSGSAERKGVRSMFYGNIKKLAEENDNFRKVIYTGKNSQLVLMSIPKGGQIGDEVHETTDQILFFVDGEAEAVLNGESQTVGEHDVVFVPQGTQHNFINKSDEDLKLFTVYSPPAHPEGTIHKTRQEAEQGEKEY